MSFFDSIITFFTSIFDFFVSVIENFLALYTVVEQAVTVPTLLSGWIFQPLAVCVVATIGVAVLKNILGRV